MEFARRLDRKCVGGQEFSKPVPRGKRRFINHNFFARHSRKHILCSPSVGLRGWVRGRVEGWFGRFEVKRKGFLGVVSVKLRA